MKQNPLNMMPNNEVSFLRILSTNPELDSGFVDFFSLENKSKICCTIYAAACKRRSQRKGWFCMKRNRVGRAHEI